MEFYLYMQYAYYKVGILPLAPDPVLKRLVGIGTFLMLCCSIVSRSFLKLGRFPKPETSKNV